jgi:HPt (histidine-containing phosphotransfer) domain-containing protein
MDLNMPVLDGWETTRRIREDSRWDRLPVLAMTAHALVEERDRCQALGMQDHLTKPIEPDTLFQALRRWGRPGEPSSQNATQSDAATPVYGDLPGFDLTGGLRRTAGNLALHRQLLNSLANTQASASRRVQEALNSNDTLEAQRIAHTVKGVAANLGATALAEAAGQLDRALQSDGSWQEPLVHFDRTLRQSVATIRSLQAAAKEPSPRPAAASTGREPGPADLERLATLLAAGDGDALELFRRLQPDLATLLGEAAVAAMAAHLERFALEAAHRELVVARQAMANRQPSPEQSRL